MQISTSTYYRKPKRDPIERAKRDADLRDRIDAIHAEFPRSGYRSMRQYLKRQGVVVSGRKLRALMKQYGLQALIKRAFVKTTDSNHRLSVYPNLLPGLYVDGINQVWVADITYSTPSHSKIVERNRECLSMFGIRKFSRKEEIIDGSSLRKNMSRSGGD